MPTCTEEDVKRYLHKNTDFFERNADLLLELKVPHATGEAVSLIEKQVSVLRERNTELRRKLSELLHNARENDRLFERSKRLILSLLEANELGDLIDALYYSLDKEFNIPFAKLILFKPAEQYTNAHHLSYAEVEPVLGRHLRAKRVVSSTMTDEEKAFLFSDQKDVASAALAVLYYKEPLGILAIGNPDAAHYHSGIGTLFLSHIAEVLNRLITRHLNQVV